ncbi:TadE/TadG family type IV pilus assembly protein [Thalassovita sp.]|uniref:TadE/TadG family type IV pilus assembly protein n=1 Tax=Thalassovita sp. TaxID=1979401 RepID=UPI0029DE83F6|nr:TadE/TadG family type IV pilus assembly protein [Thalassovita sp.]
MKHLLKSLRALRNDDHGTASVEFVIVFPFFLGLLVSSVEVSMITVRETMLERALDLTVREIRLETGTAPQHDEIKKAICERAPIIADCEDNLRLEMMQINPRAWSDPQASFDCTDQSEDVQPVRNFVNGQENQLMLLRACAKFAPIFPGAGIGKELAKDGAGMAAITAASAFVQEPQ